MTLPTKPSLDFSYTGFAQGLGNNLFPGTQLDNDLANVAGSLNETIDFVSAVIRSDGKLENGVVGPAALDSSLLLGLAPPRPWASAREYAVNETVTINNSIFICAVNHTATTFNSDLGAGLWGLVAEFTVPAAIADGTVTETKHATGAVSTRALADGSVTNAKLASGSVTLGNLAPSIALGLLPIGVECDYAGWAPPPGWLFEFGQEVSRTTYGALFNAICPGLILNTNASSQVLTGVLLDLRGLGLEGCPIEGANIPVGATVSAITANTITISLNATASAANVAARILPWGAGNGATTFNLPDARDQAAVGRGNMGGTVAGRITVAGVGNSGLSTSRLGATGGVDRHALVAAQTPSHNHGGFPNQVTVPASGWGVSGTNLGTVSAGRLVVGSGNSEFSETLESLRAAGNDLTLSLSGSTTMANVGGNEPHPNVQPSRVTNKIIFTGVV